MSKTLRDLVASSFKHGKPGHKLSDDHISKIILAHQGKSLSEETKAKMSLTHTGKVLTPEHVAKMTLARYGNNYALGHTKTEESNKQNRINQPTSIKITINNVTYDSVTQAARTLNISHRQASKY